MNSIHPTAIIGKNAKLDEGNQIGPHVVIEDDVEIGRGNIFHANAYIASGTRIGSANEIHMGAIIGHVPQDVAYRKGLVSFTRIGDHNIIREYATIHRGTEEGSSTVIGNHNFLMANAHVPHNCVVGNRVIMVNFASLSGYCVVEDEAFISGMVGLHQFVRVGRLAILSALSAANKDVPPFMLCGGRPARAQGVNVVGLRRAKIAPATREEIRQAYRLLYRSGLNVSQALEAMEKDLHSEEAKHLMAFIRASKRGIATARDGAVEMHPVDERLED